MSRRAINSLALLAVFAGSVTSLPVLAQSDGSKRSVEMRDMSKGRIEMPVKGLFLDRFKAPKNVKSAAPAKTLGSTQKPALKPQQEKVEPGKVRWHKAIQTAMEASKQSGKPVLLFQMMGHLDDRFC